jgi:hypothetical protein
MKHKEDKKTMWSNYMARRELIKDEPRRASLRTDHEHEDGYEVVAKAKFTDSDKERLRELGSQATEIVRIGSFFLFVLLLIYCCRHQNLARH